MADTHKKEENRLQPFDGGISAPAITGGELSNTLVGKKPSWFLRVFGPGPAEPTEAERLAAIREQRYSDMLRMKRNELQQQRTDATRMAQFNALGNVLTTMVQPLGWTAGGVTGGVQPYDDRQYLDAFNRAVRASDDLRNLGSLEAEYRFKVADEDYQRALKEQDYQRRRNESNEDYFARLDRQQQIKSNESYTVLIEKRRENAVKAYYQEQARRVSHKLPLISFTEFLNLDGLGKEYYGNWTPTQSEINAITAGANESAMNTESSTGADVEPAAATTATPVALSTNGAPAKAAGASRTQGASTKPLPLTAEEKAIVAKWAKYDTNNDGVLDRNEIKVYNSNRPAGAEKLSRRRNAVSPINSALKKSLEQKNKKSKATKNTNSGASIASVINNIK